MFEVIVRDGEVIDVSKWNTGTNYWLGCEDPATAAYLYWESIAG